MRDGEVQQQDLLSVVDVIFSDDISHNERLKLITKTELAVKRMAVAFEKKYKEVEDEFRVWKSGPMERLGMSDERNPLVKGEYEKITESVKKNYLRNNYDEYAEYRKKINKYRSYKNLMWNMKDAFVNLSKNFNAIKEGE
jgi:hypothetical protein